MFSYLLLVNLVVEGAAETTNQRKPTVITTIQWETESLEAGTFNPTINILRLKENTNMTLLKLGMNKCFTLSELKDLAENYKGCLGKQWIPLWKQ